MKDKKPALNVDVVCYGMEPTWEVPFTDDIERDCALARAYTWYNYMSTDGDLKKWTNEYMKKNGYSKEDISYIGQAGYTVSYGEIPDIVGFNVGKFARMILLGAPISEQDKDRLQICIKFLINKGKNQKTQKADAAVVKTAITIHERVAEKISDIVGEFEKMADDILTKKEEKKKALLTISKSESVLESLATGKKSKKKEAIEVPEVATTAKQILYSKNIKSNQCQQIADYFKSVSDTLEQDRKEEPEAYAVYSKKNLAAYENFLDEIIDSCVSYAEVNKNIIIRKKRPKSPVDMCKKVKYMLEDKKLKIRSISPTKIIGATKVLLYIPKTRKATLLESNTHHGFTISGTSILDYSDKSFSKTIRKPDEFLKEVKDKGIRVVKSALDSCNSKEGKPHNRLNTDTLIIGAY